jgi:hypothetical protein
MAAALVCMLASFVQQVETSPTSVTVYENVTIRDALVKAGYTIQPKPPAELTVDNLGNFLRASQMTHGKIAYVSIENQGRLYWIKNEAGWIKIPEIDPEAKIKLHNYFNETIGTGAIDGSMTYQTFWSLALFACFDGIIFVFVLLCLTAVGQQIGLVGTDTVKNTK